MLSYVNMLYSYFFTYQININMKKVKNKNLHPNSPHKHTLECLQTNTSILKGCLPKYLCEFRKPVEFRYKEVMLVDGFCMLRTRSKKIFVILRKFHQYQLTSRLVMGTGGELTRWSSTRNKALNNASDSWRTSWGF